MERAIISEHVASPVMDPEGFKRSLRPIRVRVSPEAPVMTSNAFQILDSTLNRNA